MLTRHQINTALPRLSKGVGRYRRLQASIHSTGFSADQSFRKAYCSFYGITPFRDTQWQQHYFNLLVEATHTPPDFTTTLRELNNRTGVVEASFTSKLVASVNTNRPVIDTWVLLNAELELPDRNAPTRLADIATLYATLDIKMHAYLSTDDGQYLVAQFTNRYGTERITEMKMLDFVLWQTRDRVPARPRKSPSPQSDP
jgi:hypothetical protein